jgi:hypothetical protein
VNRLLGRLFLAGLSIFLLMTVRIGETLTCTADASAQSMSCRRVQSKLLYATDERFRVANARSIAFHVRGHTSPGHTSVNTSSVDAVDESGRSVVLLSIPERNVAYGSEIEQRLRTLEHATPPTFSFERNERRTAWFFAGAIGAFWVGVLTLERLRDRRPTKVGS